MFHCLCLSAMAEMSAKSMKTKFLKIAMDDKKEEFSGRWKDEPKFPFLLIQAVSAFSFMKVCCLVVFVAMIISSTSTRNCYVFLLSSLPSGLICFPSMLLFELHEVMFTLSTA